MKFPSTVTFGNEFKNNNIGSYVLPEGLVQTAMGEIEGILPQCGCGGSGTAATPGESANDKIYAFGDIRAVLPSQSVEKEFYQVAVTDPADKNKPFDNVLAYKYLSRTENFYIAREMNWVFSIRGHFDLYIIKATTNRSLSILIATIAPYPGINYDILVAHKEGYTKRETTTGTDLPVVTASQIYTITNVEYIAAIMSATGANQSDAAMIFSNSLSLTNNSGDEDRYRALNFIVLRYMTFYKEVYNLMKNEHYDLTSVRAGNIDVYGKSKVLEIIFYFQSQQTSSTRSYACTIDVSKEFPYVAVPWSIYYRGI